MPDYMNYAITRQSSLRLTVPTYQIACTVVDSADQSVVLADFTGANAISFPGVLGTLTADERDEFANLIADWLIHKKAGL